MPKKTYPELYEIDHLTIPSHTSRMFAPLDELESERVIEWQEERIRRRKKRIKIHGSEFYRLHIEALVVVLRNGRPSRINHAMEPVLSILLLQAQR